jgi:hypothetical protein
MPNGSQTAASQAVMTRTEAAASGSRLSTDCTHVIRRGPSRCYGTHWGMPSLRPSYPICLGDRLIRLEASGEPGLAPAPLYRAATCINPAPPVLLRMGL